MNEDMKQTDIDLENLGGLPPKLRELFYNIYQVNGDTIEVSKIGIEDALLYYAHYPLQFYNLMYYARWSAGVYCPECGCDNIMFDITLTAFDFPFYRCSPSFEQPLHRFSGFSDTVFEHTRQPHTPILSWVRGIVYYLNMCSGKEPTLKDMVEVIGTRNKDIFWRSNTARNVVKLLKFARKTKVFGKHFKVETLGQLVRVLKWIMCFNNKAELDPTRVASLSFADRKLALTKKK
jgi:hypothetical protein